MTFSYVLATHVLTIEVTDPPLPGTGEEQRALDRRAHDRLAGRAGRRPRPTSTFALHGSPTGGLSVAATVGDGAAGAAHLRPRRSVRRRSSSGSRRSTGYLALRVPTGRRAGGAAARRAPGHPGGGRRHVPGGDRGADPGRPRRPVRGEGRQAEPGRDVEEGRPVARAVGSDGAEGRPAGLARGTRRSASRRSAQADGSWTVDGKKSWAGARYLWEVTVYAPTTDQVEVNRVTDPYSVALTLNSTHSVLVDLADKAFRPREWEKAKQPVVRPVDQTIYELHVRDFSINDTDGPGRQARAPTSRSPRNGAGRAHLRELEKAGLTTVHLLPTFDIASIQEDTALQDDPGLRPRVVRAGLRPAAGVRHGGGRRGRLQLGLRPAALVDARGLVRGGRGRRRARRRVPHDGRRAARGRPAGGARPGVQPHHGQRAVAAVGARPRGARLLPAAQRDRQRRDLDLLPERRHRARDGGEGHGRLGGDVGPRLQGRRLPVRPHGPPLGGEHGGGPDRARQADAEEGRRRRDEGLPVRRGLELRRGGRTTRCSRRPRRGSWAGRASARSPTGCATRSAAAARSTRTRASRASAPAAAPTRTATRSTARTADQLARAAHDADLVRLGMAGNLRDYAFETSAGTVQKGAEIDYNGQPAGYADSPEEVITYVDAHDNETLWDSLTYKLPTDTPMADRVRMNTVSLATTALAQTPVVLARGRRPAAQQVARPQQLQLGRLVQPARPVRPGQRLRPRSAPGARQRGQVAVPAAAAGRPGAQADPGGHRHGVEGRRRPAEAAVLDAAVPARLGRPDRAEGRLPRLGSGRRSRAWSS